MADQFASWTKLLELAQTHKTKNALREAITAAVIPVLETEPMSGYYRCAAVKGGRLLPVAIWRDEAGNLQVWRDMQPVALERVWPYAVWTPISYDWYEAATERGEKWPDEDALVAKAQTEPKPVKDEARQRAELEVAAIELDNERERIGGNNPPAEDEITALKSDIEAANANAEKLYAEIKSDDEAAAAQAARSRLNELSGTADKKRESEKAPHWEKCKAADAKWQPLVKLAKGGADFIRDALRVWETKKFKIEQEAQRKRDEDASRIAAANEAARLAAEAEGKPAPEPIAEVEQPAPVAATNTGKIKGASGRTATVTTIKVAKVVNYELAFQHLKAVIEVKKAIDTVAQRMVSAGMSVPGVEVHEERNVA